MARFLDDNFVCSLKSTHGDPQDRQEAKSHAGSCQRCGHTITAANLCTRCHDCVFCCTCRKSDFQEEVE